MGIKITCIAATVFLSAAALFAQAPTFDVASIKRTAIANGIVEFQMRPGGRLAVFGMSLRDLVRRAYGSDEIQRSEQVIGGPEWAGSDRYDIIATTDASIDSDPQKNARMLAMLRTLLEERFKLKVRRELREADVYSLVVANRDGQLGPSLRRSTIDCPIQVPGQPRSTDPVNWCGLRGGDFNGALIGQGMTMKELTALLSIFPTLGRPVRDQTGLSGKYDFRAQFTPTLVPGPTPDSPFVPNPAGDTGPSLFTAFQDQLGLKLQNDRAQVPFFVIESADHPSEN